jgi:iron(III) transport system substrate-binding protein
MKKKHLVFLLLWGILLFSGCSPNQNIDNQTLVLYSGRSENLVGPIISQFEQTTGIDVQVKWGSTSELAATLLEEGQNSQADLFFAQDPGGLGAVEDMLSPMPADILEIVPENFRDPDGKWIGISGRARVVVYNTDNVEISDLPVDLRGFADPAWRGRVGWAPTNSSFQTMITAMRKMWGEQETLIWLQAIQENNPVAYENNSSIVAAVGAGEIDAGFVNHYYLFRFLQEEGESFPARNYFSHSNGPDALVMIAGIGILESSQNTESVQQFIKFLLSPVAQQYFATQTFEYPVVEGIILPSELTPLDDLSIPAINLSDLEDLQGSISLLREAGVLP